MNALEAPARPIGVPSAATYDVELGQFEVVARDAQGRRSGDCVSYRSEDGSLYQRCHYVDGLKDGPFTVFHPNGQPATRGRYSRGVLDGDVVAYGSDADTELPLRSCCVPRGAWELRSRYREGRLVRQVFHDRAGFALAADGSRWPDRPAGVPASAEYDPESQLWIDRGDSGIDSLFSRSGVLERRVEYRAGYRVREQRYDESGRLGEERRFDVEGRFDGLSTRWFHDEATTPYADARIYEERGQFWHGQPVGSFTCLDVDRIPIVRRELGAGLSDAALLASPVFEAAIDAAPSERIWRLADELRVQGRTREALCAAARAAARERDRARFAAWIEATTLAQKPAFAAARAGRLQSSLEVKALGVLDELLLGADPALALRLLASVFRGPRRAALDFVEAALVLAPELDRARVTRALLRQEIGDIAGVLSDARELEPSAPEIAEHLRLSVRLYFAEPAFHPTREELEPPPEGSITVTTAQPLEHVQRLARVYAARLLALRRAVEALVELPEPAPWFPPDLSRWLEHDRVELRRETATVEDETEDGVETTEVTIDETLELEGWSATALMSEARANWAALCWLCWSVGLDEVAFPEAVRERDGLTAAVNRAISRCFRAKDQLNSGGLVSRSRGVPDFRWEGIEIDQLDRSFVAIAALEYLEVRSLFVWLLFAQNLSPFQSDIRAA